MPKASNDPKEPKRWHEDFARFFEKPTREGLRTILSTGGSGGEFSHIDFKEEWPSGPKLARTVLAFANTSGGCIVAGVEDGTNQPKGLKTFLDKTKVVAAIKKFVPPLLLNEIEVLDFSYTATEYPALQGKKFQVLLVEDNPEHLPFVAQTNGEGIRGAAVYTRTGTSSEEANYEQLQAIINRRLETGYSSSGEIDLQAHLSQLKELYRHFSPGGSAALMMVGTLYDMFARSNASYPKETFDAFLARIIKEKKRLIEDELGIS